VVCTLERLRSLNLCVEKHIRLYRFYNADVVVHKCFRKYGIFVVVEKHTGLFVILKVYVETSVELLVVR
jgi:hypothetical protein